MTRKGFTLTELIVGFALSMVLYAMILGMVVFVGRIWIAQGANMQYQTINDSIEAVIQNQMDLSGEVWFGFDELEPYQSNRLVFRDDGSVVLNEVPLYQMAEPLVFVKLDRMEDDHFTYILILTDANRKVLYQKQHMISFLTLRNSWQSISYGVRRVDSSMETVIWYYR